MQGEFTVKTSKKQQIVDITDDVKKIVNSSKIKEGICLIYAPHATCAIIINENYDPNVMDDILVSLNSMIPEGRWLHDSVDGNGAAHIKSAILGPSETIPIKDSELQLGQWQNLMLADFDGPRTRTVITQVIGK